MVEGYESPHDARRRERESAQEAEARYRRARAAVQREIPGAAERLNASARPDCMIEIYETTWRGRPVLRRNLHGWVLASYDRPDREPPVTIVIGNDRRLYRGKKVGPRREFVPESLAVESNDARVLKSASQMKKLGDAQRVWEFRNPTLHLEWLADLLRGVGR